MTPSVTICPHSTDHFTGWKRAPRDVIHRHVRRTKITGAEESIFEHSIFI